MVYRLRNDSGMYVHSYVLSNNCDGVDYTKSKDEAFWWDEKEEASVIRKAIKVVTGDDFLIVRSEI